VYPYAKSSLFDWRHQGQNDGPDLSIEETVKKIELKKALTALWKDDEGVTTVEYRVAGGLIVATVVTPFLNLGVCMSNIITYLNNELGASPGAGA
jgi:pilus assembly protein Flp/PilA